LHHPGYIGEIRSRSLRGGELAPTHDRLDLLKRQHDRVFRVHVEQVRSMRKFGAIEAAFIDHESPVAVGETIDHRGAHATRRRDAAEDERVDV
jgi:hypothetical protein